MTSGPTIQSYGGGVQSRALLHMALNGDLPRPDRIIFADTQAEPEAIYAAVQQDQAAASRAGIQFDVVSYGDLSATDQWGGVFIPAHTTSGRGSRGGMLRRQCTEKFKVIPIRRHLRALGINRATLWLGISLDEAIRAKSSRVKWLRHEYPLIEHGITRADCEQYLRQRGIAVAKSACVFCPYRSEMGWARVKADPSDWRKAVQYDEDVRDKRPQGGELYVHPSRLPLRDAPIPDLSAMRGLFSDEDGFGNECEGHCGV